MSNCRRIVAVDAAVIAIEDEAVAIDSDELSLTRRNTVPRWMFSSQKSFVSECEIVAARATPVPVTAGTC